MRQRFGVGVVALVCLLLGLGTAAEAKYVPNVYERDVALEISPGTERAFDWQWTRKGILNLSVESADRKQNLAQLIKLELRCSGTELPLATKSPMIYILMASHTGGPAGDCRLVVKYNRVPGYDTRSFIGKLRIVHPGWDAKTKVVPQLRAGEQISEMALFYPVAEAREIHAELVWSPMPGEQILDDPRLILEVWANPTDGEVGVSGAPPGRRLLKKVESAAGVKELNLKFLDLTDTAKLKGPYRIEFLARNAGKYNLRDVKLRVGAAK